LKRVAGIGGADIVIVAIEKSTICARSLHAVVALGAGVAVVTFRVVDDVLALPRLVTKVIGAVITIIAVKQIA